MSKYHNTYQRIYQEKYRFLDTVTQPSSPYNIVFLYVLELPILLRGRQVFQMLKHHAQRCLQGLFYLTQCQLF